MKLLIFCLLSGFLSSCVQNKQTDLPHRVYNRAHLGSGYYVSGSSYGGGGSGDYDYNHDGAFDRDDRSKSRSRDSSPTRQRQFITENGESLRDKLEAKKR